uniref:Uncharacterized protein n=1 Tax=Anguilla anguilla TaxID=7936 RepID=A0A0E9T0J2_ANGAN
MPLPPPPMDTVIITKSTILRSKEFGGKPCKIRARGLHKYKGKEEPYLPTSSFPSYL